MRVSFSLFFFLTLSYLFLLHFEQRLLEQIELYEVNNFNSVSQFMSFFGQLCTIRALRDVCRFIIGAIFGPYAPNHYYDVMFQIFRIDNLNLCGEIFMLYQFASFRSKATTARIYICESKWR